MFKKKILFSLGTSGQLGNQYALLIHYIAFAKKNNATINILTFNNYKLKFNTALAPINFIVPNKSVYYTFLLGLKCFINLFFKNRNLCLFNYFFIINKSLKNTDKFFKRISNNKYFFIVTSNCDLRFKPEVKAQLQWLQHCLPLKTQYLEQVERNVAQMNVDLVNVYNIGIHIRRGDYKTWQNGEHYFEIDMYYEYMVKIKRICGKKNIKFIIFSNEIFEFDNTAGLDLVYSYASAIIDLFTMSKLNLLCGPPSSFSGCASFIGNVPFLQLSANFFLNDVLNIDAAVYKI